MRGPAGIARPPVDLGDKGGQGSCFHRGPSDAVALFCDVETKEARVIAWPFRKKRKNSRYSRFGVVVEHGGKKICVGGC